ncbi:hypothetical protein M885DRAFT_412496, partial [Pelagophyceae sp. CCMP2097]
MVDIPTLPRGSLLRLELLGTWGDPHYIGLHGIEAFDELGRPVQVESVQADPPSINVLPEYSADPRTADKLVDGVNATCDELHAWLAPYDSTAEHSISLMFARTVSLSMLRIWNYNKSRAHSYRGVRGLRASLDGAAIFQGEVRKAAGCLDGCSVEAEMILFTLDAATLKAIEAHDVGLSAADAAAALEGAVRRLEERPTTADSTDGATGAARAASLRRTTRAQQPGHTYDEMRLDEGLEPEKHGVRPRTSLAGAKDAAKASSLLDFSPPDDASPRGAPPAPPSERSLQKAAQRAVEADARAPPSGVLPRARRIKIRIESTWGDAHYVGLNGVRVLIGDGARPCSLSAAQLTAEPRDLRSL